MSKYFIFIPNLLSIIRIGLVYPILNNIFIGNFLISLIYFLLASITDALDGFLARRMKWQTYLGTILDPIADKLLLSGTIFILWLNFYIPLYIFVIFIGRDVAILLGAAVHMTLIESETPLPNILGKITTGLQIAYIVIIFLFQIFNVDMTLILLDTFILVVTLMSLIVYAKNWFRNINEYHNE
ncbi:MAG: CDP-alcohol phosphatidyltransferase family protein [SAR86 cluster bacterium]|uniref:CDP-diacylglycerol--glycerol-3-phosphate 3-phosphatidyltransferase n=1 Tax=SAR86 cluster bacterium TaxID=2030880 RepID=A0A937LLM1_9GAMM|nr:CDP-alcohol phosphatidyltransferase family protein [SAR86 cluster bacterium]